MKKTKSAYETVINRIIAATPLLCVITYLLLGFVGELWHPGWIVFIAVPIVPMILKPSGFKAGFPLIVAVVYLILGFTIDFWHPGWIMFLLIPVFYIFFPETKSKKTIEVVVYKEKTETDEEL